MNGSQRVNIPKQHHNMPIDKQFVFFCENVSQEKYISSAQGTLALVMKNVKYFMMMTITVRH